MIVKHSLQAGKYPYCETRTINTANYHDWRKIIQENLKVKHLEMDQFLSQFTDVVSPISMLAEYWMTTRTQVKNSGHKDTHINANRSSDSKFTRIATLSWRKKIADLWLKSADQISLRK